MIKVFVDSSVMFAATYSEKGYARDLINLGLQVKLLLCISPLVLEETRRNIAKAAPAKSSVLEQIITDVAFELVANPTKEEVLAVAEYTSLKDAAIVAAARGATVDYLVTYDRKHLIDPPRVAEKSGLKIVTPDVVVILLQSGGNGENETDEKLS